MLKKEEVYRHTYDSPAFAREKLTVLHRHNNACVRTGANPKGWQGIGRAGSGTAARSRSDCRRGKLELAAKQKIEELLAKDAQSGSAA